MITFSKLFARKYEMSIFRCYFRLFTWLPRFLSDSTVKGDAILRRFGKFFWRKRNYWGVMIFGSKYCFICQCATRIVGIVVGVVVHFVCKSVPQQRPSSNLTDDVASVIGTDQDHKQRRKQMADIFLVLPKQIGYNLSLFLGLTDFRWSKCSTIQVHRKRTTLHTWLDCLNITEVTQSKGLPVKALRHETIRQFGFNRIEAIEAQQQPYCALGFIATHMSKGEDDASIFTVLQSLPEKVSVEIYARFAQRSKWYFLGDSVKSNPLHRYVPWPAEKNQAF